jgi:hypothetical protein
MAALAVFAVTPLVSARAARLVEFPGDDLDVRRRTLRLALSLALGCFAFGAFLMRDLPSPIDGRVASAKLFYSKGWNCDLRVTTESGTEHLVLDAGACAVLVSGSRVTKSAWSLKLEAGPKAYPVESWFAFAACVGFGVMFLAGGLWIFSAPTPPPAAPVARVAWGQPDSWTVTFPSSEAGPLKDDVPPKDRET